jgi:uncharacterized protein YbaA (DUF1428 family)
MPSTADNYFANVVNAQDKAFFGTIVAIRRGVFRETGVQAIVEIMQNDVEEQDTGIRTVVQSRDYVFDKAEYVVNDIAVEPRRGDQIEEELDGVTRLFEAVPIGDLPDHQDEDADGLRWRIRTREVGS